MIPSYDKYLEKYRVVVDPLKVARKKWKKIARVARYNIKRDRLFFGIYNMNLTIDESIFVQDQFAAYGWRATITQQYDSEYMNNKTKIVLVKLPNA